ncbi:hypothetical protein PHET_00072 [Paragonimus heterotremus]|uniref:Uncharacterized protein n=1 Tax=Paragonimus heterotremus TaxID=100268 RepID=A0A8J4WK51_9TREM|nr:hypothetical protein PHET_00072 [Paragonimus heterotremus]
MYVTATTPYIFMFILLGRALSLDGSLHGLRYYVIPDWKKLATLTVWADAGSQIFFSYSISLGSLTALGSYNPFRHNAFRDCVIYASVNTFTSLLAGLIIFSTLGHMSTVANVPISSVAESGPGLAFVVYPKALSIMPISPFWCQAYRSEHADYVWNELWIFTNYVLSLFIISVLIYEELTYERASKPEVYQYPDWAVKVGWLLASSSVFMIPIVMLVQILRTPGSLCQRIKTLCRPQLTESQLIRIESNPEGFRQSADGETSTTITVMNGPFLTQPDEVPTSTT